MSITEILTSIKHTRPLFLLGFFVCLIGTGAVLRANADVLPLPGREFAGSPSKVWEFNDLNGINIAKDSQPVYNQEAQVYTYRQKNVRAEKGTLVLGAHKESYKGKSYTSGWVDTEGRFSAEYGKWEATIKVPAGQGTWPAFWLLSDNTPFTSKLKPTVTDWAKDRFYMKDGEIDIMEHYGTRPGVIEGTLHAYNKTTEKSIVIKDATSAYHTYGVEVTPAKLTWTVDGKAFQTIYKTSSNSDDWPVGGGNKFYYILNLALGGEGGGTITDTPSKSWRMDVQNVSYYPYIK